MVYRIAISIIFKEATHFVKTGTGLQVENTK